MRNLAMLGLVGFTVIFGTLPASRLHAEDIVQNPISNTLGNIAASSRKNIIYLESRSLETICDNEIQPVNNQILLSQRNGEKPPRPVACGETVEVEGEGASTSLGQAQESALFDALSKVKCGAGCAPILVGVVGEPKVTVGKDGPFKGYFFFETKFRITCIRVQVRIRK